MTHVMENYFNDIVDSICKTVKFDSSLKPAEGEYPFGKETADCLGYFLSSPRGWALKRTTTTTTSGK
ncbi:MAG: hypothetical protein ACLR06_12450 [Christensenellaceae bacterium]